MKATLPKNWRLGKLGDVIVDARPGFACGDDVEDGIIHFRMNNVTREGTIDWSKIRRVPRERKKIEELHVQPGDLLFNSTSSPELVGKCTVFPGNPEPVTFSNHFHRLRPDHSRADSRFIRRWITLQWGRGVFEGMCRQWVNQATVTKDALLGLNIPLPPLAEQRQIAEVLDRAEALRAKRRAALAQFDPLTQSLFLDLFGDPATNPKGFPKKPLASLVRDDDTINYGVVQPGDDLDEGIPLIRVGDLIEGKVRHSELKRIAPSIEAAYKRSRLLGDEILVSCVGSIGVVALANESVKGFNIARAIARIPLAETTDRIFMAAYLGTDFVQRYFTNELRTVSQPTLNIKQISETTVVLPPIDQQREFARRVAAVEKLKTAQRASLAELDALFASLQHRAFRGEL